MNSYIYNPLNAPQFVGSNMFPPRTYVVVDEATVARLKAGNVDVHIEGDDKFRPLFVVNIPAKIPNQL